MENEEQLSEWKSKGGRPKLSAGERRDFMLRIRLTEQERKDLAELASEAGYNDVSVYARNKLFAPAHTPIHNPKQLFRAIDKTGAALKRVGTNINQIARYVHYLEKNNMVEGKVIAEYNQHFQEFLQVEEEYVKAIRTYLRTVR
ncbi:plasmid mobilization relaxosome protein MobC [Pontibacter diazotrophicus]|uniref:Plasmid mobilization relaxosome protein MobC n=1 Tax=Pontibacter diazotrophicus TaxID=1400979 RepID=A0A3D8L3C9_9BACT|nr:plasmid mobilization relaxosome protein MobC [Pontibacter diazotrophicus]RDV11880.1 plasmid mobilization relaxosome protein MobC [Pontibacter diazotrophicus]